MKLVEVISRICDGSARLSGIIEREGGDTVEVFYEFPEQWSSFLFDGADPFVAAMVIPAMMSTATTVHIAPPVSERMLEGARTYIEAISLMRPDQMHRVELTASHPVARQEQPAQGVGAFFSLGVDSFYTLLTNAHGLPTPSPRITHLIHWRGLQEPLSTECGADETESLVHCVAEQVRLPVITGRTNLRDVMIEPKWGRFHGAGLASVGLALSRGLGRVLTPSAHSYANLHGIGCHPLIDPLWSTELLRVSVDGAERNRRDKIVELVGCDPIARQYLRVCLKNRGAAHNCGRCQKCIRTMLTLHLMGALKDVATFPDEFTPGLLKLLFIRSQSEYVHAKEVYDYAVRQGAEPWIRRRLRKMLRRREMREAIETIIGDSPWRLLLTAHDRTRQAWWRLRDRLRYSSHADVPSVPPVAPTEHDALRTSAQPVKPG